MLNSRFFNHITIIDDNTIRKTSSDKTKIIAEYKWFKNTSVFKYPKVSNLIVNDDSASYDLEYIHGRTLADLYVNETLPLDVFNKIFTFVANKIKECHLAGCDTADLKYKDQLSSMYKKKTLERLSHTNIDLYTEYTINGQKCPKLIDIINECDVPVEDSDICSIHGDLCFSNILLKDTYDYEGNIEDYLYFIDPRGILPDGTITSIGDYKYDVGKLGHSVIGLYDMIKSGNLVASQVSPTEFTLDVSKMYYKICVGTLYTTVFGEDPMWYNIMIHLFLSMIPLHADKPDHQTTMLANALRLYQERKKFVK